MLSKEDLCMIINYCQCKLPLFVPFPVKGEAYTGDFDSEEELI